MIKTMVIAPYSGLAETAKNINVPSEFDVTIEIGNLEEGIKVAQAAEKNGYDLIISRGGTASLIQEAVSIPVVHIDITGYDMLRVFTLIKGIETGVALVGFPNISQGAATLCNILEFNVNLVTIHSREEVKEKLKELKHEGYTVVIGDVVTVQVAEQIGLRGVLITSGKEALLDAFAEGKRMHSLFHHVNDKFNFLMDTFRSLPYPLLLLNENGEIIEKNISFDKQVNPELLALQTVHQLIKRAIEFNTNQWDDVIVSDHHYGLLAFPISKKESMIGLMVHTSSEITKPKAVRITNGTGHIPILGNSVKAHRLRDHLIRYANANEPICLIGEPGTGKETLAKIIHFEKFNQSHPLIEVDGSTITEPELRDLQSKLTLFQKGSILLKHVPAMSPEIQQHVLKLLQHTPAAMQILSVTNKSLDKLVQQGKFNEKFYKIIAKLTLHLPPLRERKGDIPAFVNYFLSEFHAESGNETLGMKPEAMEYLKNHEWYGNFTQLKQVIRELSMLSNDYYIGLPLVKEITDQISGMENKSENDTIPIHGTLQEIEQQIIEQVLKEENNNQSKAAARLGINRTTLWRKLNK